jgi:glycosyltransferase involved in cell wall biosynthesis
MSIKPGSAGGCRVPVVSVIMSVYNGERHLAEAIESILDQTFRDFEFIIINDGSTDGTADILGRYQRRDERIQVYPQDNHGLIASLNRGVRLAQGACIARMDADDVSLPERLGKQVGFLDLHPQIGVLGSAVQVTDDNGHVYDTWRFPTTPAFLRWSLCFYNPIPHPTVMMRRQAVVRVGGYASDMLHAEDYDLWRRLSSITLLSNMEDVLLLLRKHEASISKVHFVQQRQTSIRISQLMISETVGGEVPHTVVESLWGEPTDSLTSVREEAKLIQRLYRASIANDALSADEKQMISRDASLRLLAMTRRQRSLAGVLAALAHAFRLNPFFVGQELTRAVGGSLSRGIFGGLWGTRRLFCRGR